LAGINTTSGQNAEFRFDETTGNNVASCKFGVDNGGAAQPDPTLLEITYNQSGWQNVSSDARVSFIGERSRKLWFKMENVRVVDAKTYRLWCQFSNGGSNTNAKAQLYVMEGM